MPDAKRWATEMESEISRGVFVDRTEVDNPRGDLIRRYQVEITPSKAGGDREKGYLAAILDDQISLMRMTMLASRDVGAFRGRMMATVGYGPATIVRGMNHSGTQAATGLFITPPAAGGHRSMRKEDQPLVEPKVRSRP